MSDPNHAPYHAVPASKTLYFVVYAAIAVLILLAAGVSFMEMPSGRRVYYNLFIAGAQMCLLSYFFMHLKGAEPLTWLMAGGGLFFIFILFLFVLTDYVTRDFAAY
jgi:caa(3)-type oxidase subunit IV